MRWFNSVIELTRLPGSLFMRSKIIKNLKSHQKIRLFLNISIKKPLFIREFIN